MKNHENVIKKENVQSSYLGPAVNRQPGLRRERLAELTNTLGKKQPTTQTNPQPNHYNKTTQVNNYKQQQPDATTKLNPKPSKPKHQPAHTTPTKSRNPNPAQLSQP